MDKIPISLPVVVEGKYDQRWSGKNDSLSHPVFYSVG